MSLENILNDFLFYERYYFANIVHIAIQYIFAFKQFMQKYRLNMLKK